MDFTQIRASLVSLKGQNTNAAEALQAAIDIIDNGYSSDEVAKNASIAEGIAQGIEQFKQAAKNAVDNTVV